MARAVYSTRFIGGTPSLDAYLDYTVPAGYVAVVRDVTVLQAAGGGGLASVLVLDPEFWLFYMATPTTNTALTTLSMRSVVMEGETIEARATGSALTSVVVSGYLLSA